MTAAKLILQCNARPLVLQGQSEEKAKKKIAVAMNALLHVQEA